MISRRVCPTKKLPKTWVKNKEKIIKAYEAGRAKRQRLKTGELEDIDAATYKWVLSKRCENVPITALLVQSQALNFQKSWKLLTIKHHMDGSEIGRKGKLAILRDPCLEKVELESFLDDAMNTSSIELNW